MLQLDFGISVKCVFSHQVEGMDQHVAFLSPSPLDKQFRQRK